MKYYRVCVFYGENNTEGVSVEITRKEANYLLEEVKKKHEIEKEEISNGQKWYKVDGKIIMIEGERTW